MDFFPHDLTLTKYHWVSAEIFLECIQEGLWRHSTRWSGKGSKRAPVLFVPHRLPKYIQDISNFSSYVTDPFANPRNSR